MHLAFSFYSLSPRFTTTFSSRFSSHFSSMSFTFSRSSKIKLEWVDYGGVLGFKGCQMTFFHTACTRDDPRAGMPCCINGEDLLFSLHPLLIIDIIHCLLECAGNTSVGSIEFYEFIVDDRDFTWKQKTKVHSVIAGHHRGFRRLTAGNIGGVPPHIIAYWLITLT